jgi:hypothetical protein
MAGIPIKPGYVTGIDWKWIEDIVDQFRVHHT